MAGRPVGDAERASLIDDVDNVVTLNGIPAIISGRLETFATVRVFGAFGAAAAAEFSWEAVRRICRRSHPRRGRFVMEYHP